jgi:chemotaxis protein methyltransferase CheR
MEHRRLATAEFAPGESAVADPQREFAFSDTDFREVTRFAYEHAGIALSDSKRNLVYSRLSRRLRTLGLTSFREYRDYLAANNAELQNFVNAISTNLTKFFRESHHFDHFRAHVAAPFGQAGLKMGGQRFRVWSAGCSTGEEPYTIAMVLRREIRNIERHDVRVLATDIDTEVISKAELGEYPVSSKENIPAVYREYLESSARRSAAQSFTMAEKIRSLIAFRHLNLMEPWPFSGLFDAIFCRNVMIYFDNPTKKKLVERFTQQIKPGGWLYIGHSESLIGTHPGLKLVGRTIYRRET